MQCSICTHNPSSPPLYTHDSFFYQENVRCERKLIGYLKNIHDDVFYKYIFGGQTVQTISFLRKGKKILNLDHNVEK